MVTIKHEYGHYTIYVNGNFYCTADTREEAEREKQQAEKELEQSGWNIPDLFFLSSNYILYTNCLKTLWYFVQYFYWQEKLSVLY